MTKRASGMWMQLNVDVRDLEKLITFGNNVQGVSGHLHGTHLAHRTLALIRFMFLCLSFCNVYGDEFSLKKVETSILHLFCKKQKFLLLHHTFQ